jgi:di/tricarboxylate transporter
VVPGGYRFMDFVKVGTPMGLMVMAVSLLVIPLLFPL